MPPEFPQFKPIQLEDSEAIKKYLWEYQPQTSEFTFTNLFIWRSHFGLSWSLYRDWILFLCNTGSNGHYALQPIGPSPRVDATNILLKWLRDEKDESNPHIERADQRLVSEIERTNTFMIEATREHFDYIYRTDDLIHLPGNKYHAKRKQISNFVHAHAFTYDRLKEKHIRACIELTEVWCGKHRCEEDMNLLGEWEAIGEALANYQDLNIHGGVILINNKVEAFTIGELINEKTGVIHIEKANPEMKELYAVINQKFAENSLHTVPFINREQDLGVEGLRKIKLSYHPEELVKKFRITLTEEKQENNGEDKKN